MTNPLPEVTAALRTKRGIRGIRGFLILTGFAMMLGATAWSTATWLYEYWDYIVINRPSPTALVGLAGLTLLVIAATWKCSESETD